MNQYNIMLKLAASKRSPLYNRDGSHNVGALHRSTFWKGYEYGFRHTNLIPETSSIAYCIFRAGMDFKTLEGK